MSEPCTCPNCIEKTRPKGHHKMCRCQPCRSIDNNYQWHYWYPTIYPYTHTIPWTTSAYTQVGSGTYTAGTNIAALKA